MTLRDALLLGRVSNLPTVLTNVLAGLALAGAVTGDVPPALPVLGLWLAMVLMYVAGMYLNDAFDAAIDARERPERPIPSGRVPARTVFTAGFAMMGLAVAVLLGLGYGVSGATGWHGAAWGLALAAVIVFYDRFHKNNPLSPVVMGLCRLGVYVTSGAVLSATLPPDLWIGAGVLVCYLVGLTYAAKQETLGRVTNQWPLVFLAVPVAYLAPQAIVGTSGLVLFAAFVVWTFRCLRLLARRQGPDVPMAVTGLIAGMCLLDALLIGSTGAWTLAVAAAFGFPITLAFQKFIPGT